MKQDLLNLYSINMKYNRDLQNADDNVMSVSPQSGKDTRKFVGVVVIVEAKRYCIPITSFKDKFEIKSKEDFIKIPHPKDKNVNGAPRTIAVLNLNNMIPVADFMIQKIDLSKKCPEQNLLINELRWCRENASVITNRANKLYNKITLTPQKDKRLTRRCCDFKKLEQVLEKWVAKELDKSNEILNANPKLKADLNAATVEYYQTHNITPLDTSSSFTERYEMREKVLDNNPKLKAELSKLLKPEKQKQLVQTAAKSKGSSQYNLDNFANNDNAENTPKAKQQGKKKIKPKKGSGTKH